MKIGDFSESRRLKLGRLLRSGRQIGSPFAMSPELVKRGKYDFRTDVWSLGVTLFYLAFQRFPFQDDSIPALHKAITTKDIIFPRK